MPAIQQQGRFSVPAFLCAMKSLARIVPVFILTVGSMFSARPTARAESMAQGCTLRVHADNLRNAKGVVGVLLFSSPDGRPEDTSKSFRHEAVSISGADQQATVLFNGIPPNDYGVMALHDENKNMKLDKNMFGWPKEGFGFANNPHAGLGAPGFLLAFLHVTCPATETQIHIVYK